MNWVWQLVGALMSRERIGMCRELFELPGGMGFSGDVGFLDTEGKGRGCPWCHRVSSALCAAAILQPCCQFHLLVAVAGQCTTEVRGSRGEAGNFLS